MSGLPWLYPHHAKSANPKLHSLFTLSEETADEISRTHLVFLSHLADRPTNRTNESGWHAGVMDKADVAWAHAFASMKGSLYVINCFRAGATHELLGVLLSINARNPCQRPLTGGYSQHGLLLSWLQVPSSSGFPKIGTTDFLHIAHCWSCLLCHW